LSIKKAMETSSRIIFGNSNKMDSIDSESVDLIVTSPSYPMIKIGMKCFAIKIYPSEKRFKSISSLSYFQNN